MDNGIKTGMAVNYTVNGETVFGGVVEYVTEGWAGIRQADGRLDEARAEFLVARR